MRNEFCKVKESVRCEKQRYPRKPKGLREKMDLWRSMENGDIEALMTLSLLRGVISWRQYDLYKEFDVFREGGAGERTTQ